MKRNSKTYVAFKITYEVGFQELINIFCMHSKILFPDCTTRYYGSTYIKFSFSEKAMKIYAIFLMVLTFSKCQNHEEDYANFCGLLRKAELYVSTSIIPSSAVWKKMYECMQNRFIKS